MAGVQYGMKNCIKGGSIRKGESHCSSGWLHTAGNIDNIQLTQWARRKRFSNLEDPA